MSAISELDRSLKDYSISEYEPDWDEIPEERVQWLNCSMPFTGAEDIGKHLGTIDHKWTKEIVKIAPHPFSEGAQRISFKGQRIYGCGGDLKDDVVLKEFKHFGPARDRREDYIEIMETQAVSAFMAKQFNRFSPPGTKKIEFLDVGVIQVNTDDGTPKYYNVEVMLKDYKTNYLKWNNNSGYVNIDSFAATLDAFCHWTHDVTEGYLMVVDLQGVLRGTNYVLTDPSIHCKEPRFGSTNFGVIGFQAFFMSHSCGDICRKMGLKSN